MVVMSTFESFNAFSTSPPLSPVPSDTGRRHHPHSTEERHEASMVHCSVKCAILSSSETHGLAKKARRSEGALKSTQENSYQLKRNQVSTN